MFIASHTVGHVRKSLILEFCSARVYLEPWEMKCKQVTFLPPL